MSGQRPIRNVGVFAHVDAGKTTTTEQMLYLSGAIRSAGSVDEGTTQTDSLGVERARGISVRSAVTRFRWRDVDVNLVDTPGHVDFVSEVERCMRVLDGAVLIVSAVEGVQAQTEVIWHALRDLRIPTLIYVNKMDRIGAEPERVMDDIRRHLSADAVPVQAPIGAEAAFAGTVDWLTEPERTAPDAVRYAALLTEAVAEKDDALLATYLDVGALSAGAIASALPRLVGDNRLFPVLFGASGRGIGADKLMDAVAALLPGPNGNADGPVSGVVFKIERDPSMGRVAYVRLYSGTIRNRDLVANPTQGIEEKATQIRVADGRRGGDIGVLEAGDIAAVCGWQRARIGDIVGVPDFVPGERRLAEPLLTVQARWRSEAQYPAVVAACQELADEDPRLDAQWLKDERELHLKVMGPIQVEVLGELLKDRFRLEVDFDAPTVIYKETPAGPGEGFVAYTMPKPCWAILRFRIEPGPRGSGVVYDSVVRPDQLLERYQNEVARRVPEALEQGMYGWEVTDVKITLTYGEHHVWHTHPLDFVVATPMGIMDGLRKVGTKLLEPLLEFRISVPEEYGGKLLGELAAMRGTFDPPELRDGRMDIRGRLPVATSLDFPARFGSLTKGRGMLATRFAGYEDAPPDVVATRKRRGVNPLDTSKYILATRNALSAQ